MIFLQTTYPEHLTTQEVYTALIFFIVMGTIIIFRKIDIFRPIFKIVMCFFVALGLKFGVGYFKKD